MKHNKGKLERSLLYIEPGNVVLVTTNDGKKDNVMTISWTIALDFKQKIAICTGSWNLSFDTMMKTKECVVAIPPASMAETVIKIGDVSGKDVDKFEKFPITKAKAEKINAPLINECVANLECKVIDYIEKHNLVILKVVNLWENPELKDAKLFHAMGDGRCVIDGETIDYRKFMADKIPEGL